MDLVYMPEVLSYGPLRGPVYRDYEQPWNQDYFNYGKPANSQDKTTSQKSRCDQQREHCDLCKQNKRRLLSTYIRKNRTNSCSDISEEREETVDEAENNNSSINKNIEKTTELRGQNNNNNNSNSKSKFFARFERKC